MEPSVVLFNVLVVVWGFFVSFVEERWGRFQDWPPENKQRFNAFLAWVVPVLASSGLFVWWKPELGNVEEVLVALALFVAPFVAWVVSQVAHYVDKLLAKWSA